MDVGERMPCGHFYNPDKPPEFIFADRAAAFKRIVDKHDVKLSKKKRKAMDRWATGCPDCGEVHSEENNDDSDTTT